MCGGLGVKGLGFWNFGGRFCGVRNVGILQKLEYSPILLISFMTLVYAQQNGLKHPFRNCFGSKFRFQHYLQKPWVYVGGNQRKVL